MTGRMAGLSGRDVRVPPHQSRDLSKAGGHVTELNGTTCQLTDWLDLFVVA